MTLTFDDRATLGTLEAARAELLEAMEDAERQLRADAGHTHASADELDDMYRLLVADATLRSQRPREMNAKGAAVARSVDANRADIPLASPAEVSDRAAAFDGLLATRHSTRDFDDDPISFGELSAMLSTMCRLRGRGESYERLDHPFLTLPTSGGLQSTAIYLAAQRVDGIECGVLEYCPTERGLRRVSTGNYMSTVRDICQGSEWALYAHVVFILVADLRRLLWKYGTRSFRVGHVDAGVAVLATYLAAAAHGLGACAMAGVDRQLVADRLYLSPFEIPVVAVAAGRPRVSTQSSGCWY
jgi:SagB-type dehydrogenase family enzyme